MVLSCNSLRLLVPKAFELPVVFFNLFFFASIFSLLSICYVEVVGKKCS